MKVIGRIRVGNRWVMVERIRVSEEGVLKAKTTEGRFTTNAWYEALGERDARGVELFVRDVVRFPSGEQALILKVEGEVVLLSRGEDSFESFRHMTKVGDWFSEERWAKDLVETAFPLHYHEIVI